jgi:hypothetical protein
MSCDIFIKLDNEELHNSYSSPSIIRMIKSRRMRCMACSTNGGKEECLWDIGEKAKRNESIRKTKT